MATEDDNFDIDIYGDGSGYNNNEQGDQNQDDTELVLDAPETAPSAPSSNTNQANNTNNVNHSNHSNNAPIESSRPVESAPASNGDHTMTNQQTPAQDGPAPPHGVKRKDYDDRPSDPDATSALLISDLFWWETDDDIRGWIASAGSEEELKDVTFSEHKVNGKSKGQAFVEFTTPQAATASKHKIESGSGPGQSGRKHQVNYTNPHQNPFRTLPKDAPMRKDANRSVGGNFNSGGNQNNNFGMNMGGGGYRGGRGGFNNRGMGGNNFNNRGNFNNMGGFQGGGGPGMMGGFQGGPMGGMQNYGFNNRGGMMGGMRGGPGGMRGRGGGNMGGNNMMGMPGMNPMAGGMGMNPMAGGMNPMMNMGMQGQGFQGANPAGFNQGFFNNQGGSGSGGNDSSWNPHGAKRSRQE